ncbi:MAG: Arc family DNA-binding protein [Magnetococcales bacterium]|nr:Arc family DNA-binding protein [Magnetococcales bacterium]
MVRQKFPSDDDRYTVSFPAGMKELIKEAAKRNNRTMNAEIVARLAGSFDPVAVPEAVEMSRLLDIAFFRANPVSVCFRHAVVDGNVGKYASGSLQSSIFEFWQEKLVDMDITDEGEIELGEMGLEIFADVRLTSDGTNWILERLEIVSVGQVSGDIIMDEEKSIFQVKAQAEDAFFAAVRDHINDFKENFHNGNVEITNSHMLDWPRELLKSLGPPLHVDYLSPRPLPKGGLFGK